MRIQHNIPALTAYRNYSNNVSAVNKNLEKLSSGYRINRAGDDAAGLAISEKMRLQISGLEQAQNNAKSGINLVQTAEGALTEVHDMLNRMYTLAEQSANGTYSDEVDREQLQKEVNSLRTEINRIADATNYNGIQLLDGSLSGGASGAGGAADVAVEITGGGKKGLADGAAVAQETTVTFADVTPDSTLAAGDKITLTVEMTDGTKHEYTLDVGSGGTALSYNGTALTAVVTAAKPTGAQLSKALAEVMSKDSSITDKYTPDGTAAGFKLTSAEEGFGDASIKVATVSINGKNYSNLAGSVTTEGKGEFQTFNTADVQIYDASDATMKAENSIYTVNGKKFAFAKDADSAKALGSDVNVVITGDTTAPDNVDATSMVNLMNQKLGTNFQVDGTTDTMINMISKGGIDKGAGGAGSGLVLQIGDTADDYNKLTVSVKDMHADAMGIGGIDISTQEGASAAMDAIKAATNYVSDVRGDLGALQNRLDHTINNLSVTQQNITDAESTIRDVDIAKEMMAYTKNNILVQSAQAMLAQANQLPQGVLQLLG